MQSLRPGNVIQAELLGDFVVNDPVAHVRRFQKETDDRLSFVAGAADTDSFVLDIVGKTGSTLGSISTARSRTLGWTTLLG